MQHVIREPTDGFVHDAPAVVRLGSGRAEAARLALQTLPRRAEGAGFRSDFKSELLP